MDHLSVNNEAFKIVKTVLGAAECLDVHVSQLANGTTVIDMGQQVAGSWLAGKYYAEITMGGLAEVGFQPLHLGDLRLPSVHVASAHPLLAGWVCQKHAEPLTDGPPPPFPGARADQQHHHRSHILSR